MNLEKLEFGLIDQLIKVIGLKSFQRLLWDKVKESFNESFRDAQTEFDFKRTKPDPEAIEYLKQRQFILSQKTIDRLHGDLRFHLLEGIRANDSIKEMVERIRPIFDRMKDYELERLARTEILNAMNTGRLNAYEKSGIVKYVQWKCHKDARTSDICKRLDGQIIKLGEELFTDPETGAQFRNPPAHPNCRSTIIPLRKLPEITYNSGYRYVTKIEFDIGALTKQEKHYEYVTVHPKTGKPFKRKQLVGRKEPEKKDKIISDIIDRLDKYSKEYKEDGNAELERTSNKVKELLMEGKEKDALEVAMKSDLKYDISNTVKQIKDYVNKKYTEEKFDENWGKEPGIYTAYRAGSIENTGRGIFFSVDRKGAEQYSWGGKRPTKEYKVNIKNPLVAEKMNDAFDKLGGKGRKKWKETLDPVDYQRKMDVKVAALAKKKGYDAIVYIKPAPPALRELVLLDNENIIESASKFEIDINSLQKQEKYKKRVLVHRKGQKPFYREQLVGRKEPEKKGKESGIGKKETAMTPDNVVNVQSLNDIGVEGNLHDLESFIVEFKDKSQALYKTIEPIGVIGETNAFKANEVLGWDIVPETVKGDFGHGEGSCQKWVEGEEPYDPYNDYGEKITEKNIDDLAKIFAFDVIVNNRDRHVGNFLVTEDKIWAIDNEEFGFFDAEDYSMERLDNACRWGNRGGYGILQAIENSFGDDQEVFKNFRNLVMDKLKEIVDKKDEILRIYAPIEGYKVKRKAIEESFDDIANRIRESEGEK